MTKARAPRVLPTVILALFAACSPAPRVSLPAGAALPAPSVSLPPGAALPAPSVAEHSAARVSNAPASLGTPLTSCREIGPLACPLAPNPPSRECERFNECTRPPPGLNVDGLSLECERPDGSGRAKPTFENEQGAPAETGVLGTALVELRAYNDMTMEFGASYLVARFAEGFCLVDNALDWDNLRSYFETDFATRWERGASGFRFHLAAHRVSHESLDQEELATDVSDVVSEICTRQTYDVRGGHFTRVERATSNGGCQADETP
jgi:hypothetical protein